VRIGRAESKRFAAGSGWNFMKTEDARLPDVRYIDRLDGYVTSSKAFSTVTASFRIKGRNIRLGKTPAKRAPILPPSNCEGNDAEQKKYGNERGGEKASY
jgi:hypothetical protein